MTCSFLPPVSRRFVFSPVPLRCYLEEAIRSACSEDRLVGKCHASGETNRGCGDFKANMGNIMNL